MANPAARLITFEGGEGTGKSTQVRLLCRALERLGLDVMATREPGGTVSAEAIRKLLVEGDAGRWRPLTEALLHHAARYEHLVELLQPTLARGTWIVCDRFADSTLAYQGYGQGVDRLAIETMNRLVLGDMKPDLTFVLDLPVDVGLARAACRRGRETRYEGMSAQFHERIRAGFLEIARTHPDRCVVVDAGPDQETVHSAVWCSVTQRFGLGG